MSVLVVLITSVAFASAVYAQTATSTTSATSTSTTTTTTADSATAENGLLGPFFGPLFGKTHQNQNLNTVCHNRVVRHEVVNWYQQLPTDQKNALQNNLKEAYDNWYNQLPQDQKDKLQSILNQTTETT
ncbi:MAG: hypothetical protein ACXV3E_08405 [Halobacteriota archaeon]